MTKHGQTYTGNRMTVKRLFLDMRLLNSLLCLAIYARKRAVNVPFLIITCGFLALSRRFVKKTKMILGCATNTIHPQGIVGRLPAQIGAFRVLALCSTSLWITRLFSVDNSVKMWIGYV